MVRSGEGRIVRVTIRVDASVDIGSGHLMRCLTLADALTARGAECHFLCRRQPGDLLDVISAHGHNVHSLLGRQGSGAVTGWSQDADESCLVLGALHADWLVVDHYNLGEDWERRVRPNVGRLMAIDDIGRPHLCDLLLDQNLPNPVHSRYGRAEDSRKTLFLFGPQFALVRPEFAALRPLALNRRDGSLQSILVSMGGSDPGDETSKVLAGLSALAAQRWSLDIVIGAGNPNRASVEAACAQFPNARLHVQTSRMAELMVASDCAITTGGSISWERCCLGLPALVTVVSPDQVPIAEALAAAGALVFVGHSSRLTPSDYTCALSGITAERLREMSASAAAVCDGRGVERVVERLQS
jgi:UDP-2,4-diacetamido-2,4,6-trideoxy-beta-L-altropyranose hydrolase